MNIVFTYSFYGLAAVSLMVSFVKDRHKTLLSLKKAWKLFAGVFPQFVAILLFAGVVLAVLSPETIKRVIGAYTGSNLPAARRISARWPEKTCHPAGRVRQ